MTELKPCPLCGSKATMHTVWSENDGGYVAMIGCTRQTLSDSCASIWVARSYRSTAERDALRMWNRRAAK